MNVTALKESLAFVANSWFLKSKFAMRPTSCPDALPNFCLVVSDDLQNRNNLQRKVRRVEPSDLGGEKRQARHGLGYTNF
jgi:hypothetical protein